MSRKSNQLQVFTVLGQKLEYAANPNMTTKILLQKVANQLNIEEYWYFGLRYALPPTNRSKPPPGRKGSMPQINDNMRGDDDYEWMRMEKKVLAHNHLKPNGQGMYTIELRVRYFPESAEFCVADSMSLSLLFTQVRKALEAGVWDVATGRLGLQFAAMAIQFEMGNWVEHHEDPNVPRAIIQYYPKSVKQDPITNEHEIQTRASNYWKHLFGKEREEMMLLYLTYAEEHVERYGVCYFSIENNHGSKLLLGIDSAGINIYRPSDKSTPVLGFDWREIAKMNVSGAKVELYNSSDLKAKPMELVPKDGRVAKQILEQAMGALQIYRMYHDTVVEVRNELQQQFPEEEPYIPPIEEVESGALPPPITENIILPDQNTIEEQFVNPTTVSNLNAMQEQTYVEVTPAPPTDQQIPLEPIIDSTPIELPADPFPAEPVQEEDPFNAGTTYLTGSGVDRQLEPEPEPVPVPVQELTPEPEPQPAPRVSKQQPKPPEPQPEPSQVEDVGVVFQPRPELPRVQPPTAPLQVTAFDRSLLDQQLQEAEQKLRVMEMTAQLAKQEVAAVQNQLNEAKSNLEKERSQWAQTQRSMLQIVAAEQEDKRRINEEYDKLLTIAALEDLPVTKFLSVRSKFDSVSRAEWGKLWQDELRSSDQQSARPVSSTVGRYGNKRVSVAMERRRPLKDIEFDMQRKSVPLDPQDLPSVGGAGGSNGYPRTGRLESQAQLKGPAPEMFLGPLDALSEASESNPNTARGLASPHNIFSNRTPTTASTAKIPTVKRRNGERVGSLVQVYEGQANGQEVQLMNGGPASLNYNSTVASKFTG